MTFDLQNLLILRSQPSLCALFVSATFFLKPDPSPFLAITTIPLLVHLSYTHKAKTFIALCLPVLFSTTTTVDFLASSRYLVPHASQALAGQSVLSLLKSMVITFVVAGHRRIRKKKLGGVDLGPGGWQAAMGFGLLWAGAWQLWELMSPLGRFDTPSPLPLSASFIRPLHQMAGTPGVDLLLGTTHTWLTRLPTLSGHTSNQLYGTSSIAARQLLSLSKTSRYCALPYASGLLPLDHYIYQSQTLGAHSRLTVWPEGAVRLPTRAARSDAIAQVAIRVCRQYGVWVLMGAQTDTENTVGSRGEKTSPKEAILVGPQGEVGSYDKQKLVPFVESYAITKGVLPAPLWTLDLPP
ncbi:hypothetical protein IAT38_002828 [Cryptococcus sp. DSM 104549]